MHLGELGACERVVMAVVDYPRDSNVRAWAFRALIAMAAKTNISGKLMREAQSLLDFVKCLKEANWQHEQKQQRRQQQQLASKGGGR